MSSKQFTSNEWTKIFAELKKNPQNYGFPIRKYGTVLIGSFNIRKLGKVSNRTAATWKFLADICRQYDLLAVQEIMDDLEGINKLMELLGPEYSLLISDKTGVFPGDSGLGERLGYIYRWSAVRRTEIASDVSYDRSKLFKLLLDNYEEFDTAFRKKMKSKKAKLKLPHFLSFIRQPYLAGFEIPGFPGTEPYKIMVINAHLFFGNYITDRRQEFNALISWIIERIQEKDKVYFKNFMLLGDLNLDYDKPENDRGRVEDQLKKLNKKKEVKKEKIRIYFPFLDKHPDTDDYVKTNARLSETFDQIGLFSRDERLPHYTEKQDGTGIRPEITVDGHNYGVFNFVELFAQVIHHKSYIDLKPAVQAALVKRFEHKVSDHLPLWIRLKMPW